MAPGDRSDELQRDHQLGARAIPAPIWQAVAARSGAGREDAQRLQAEVITYAATISACEKGGQWQRALGLFEEFRSHGLQANVITYNATISACEKGAGKGSVAWRCSRRCTCWAAGLR